MLAGTAGTKTGKVLQSSKRPRYHFYYVICGEDFVAVFAAQGDGYSRLARIRTVAGARTGLYVPELDLLFVAARATAGESAAVWSFRPEP